MAKTFKWYERFKKSATRFQRQEKLLGLQVDHWRSIALGFLPFQRGGIAHGLFIIVDSRTYFCPNLQMKQFFDFMVGPWNEIEQFFTNVYSHDIPLCYKCKGNGKFDWVNRATTLTKTSYQRDPTVLYEYANPSKGSDRYLDLFISKTELNEGDLICPMCKGTGLVLDARHTYFEGFPGLKKDIKERKIEDVYKLLANR